MWDASSYLVQDQWLGHRLRPNVGGSDANGFRNDTVPERADIVAIGDSFTWGYNATYTDAWPQVLARRSGRQVYNMSLGGYGPVQYFVLTQQALRLYPKVIVVGLYVGNDLYDAYHLVYTNDTYAYLRSDGAESLSIDTIQAVDQTRREGRKNLEEELNATHWTGWLGKHSATVRFLSRRGWWPDFAFEQALAFAHKTGQEAIGYENGSVRTVLVASSPTLNLQEPRIAEGLRITKEMLLRIKSTCNGARVNFTVLLIPTKLLVYADVVRAKYGTLSSTYSNSIQNETVIRMEMMAVCKEGNIQCVDALQVLREAVSRNERIYPEGDDGHFLPRGYFWLATAVLDDLGKSGW